MGHHGSVLTRNTLNRDLIRKSWPMPNIETHLDAVGGAKFITLADVQSAFTSFPSLTRTSNQLLLSQRKARTALNVCRSEFVTHPGCINV